MKRARAASILLLGVLGGQAIGDDLGWRPPTTLLSKPIPLNTAVAPRGEPAGWQPARQQPVMPLAPSSTPPRSLFTPVPSAPAPLPPESLFRPVEQQKVIELPATGLYLKPKQPQLQVPVPPPEQQSDGAPVILPALPGRYIEIAPIAAQEQVQPPKLQPLQIPPVGEPAKPAAEPVKPDVPKKEAEALPPPRLLPDPKPEELDVPRKLPAEGKEPTIAPAGGEVLEPHPYLDQGVTSVPSRGRVFGSPPIRLSQDTAYRDVVGIDLLTGSTRERWFRNDEPDGPPSTRSFVQTEYLLWWANRPGIPVLATTGPEASGGVLGQPGTTSLLGPGTFGPSLRDGFRVRAGTYFNECSNLGVDGSFFFLGRRGETFATDSNQNPVLTRPFFSQNSGTEFTEVVAFPNLSRGVLEVTTDSFIWGADVNLRKALCRTCQGSYGWLAGYRHLNLTENLQITESITATGPLANDPVGTRVFVQDRFSTQNQFHGGQVGGFYNHRWGRMDVDVRASVALGVTNQSIMIEGSQQRTRPGEATQVFRGGLLATGTNLGTFTTNRFSVVPEATVNVGYMIAPGLRTYVGYNFLYWSSVVRPGDQIDRTLDVTLIPNPPPGVLPAGGNRPAVPFRQSDFWAQGMQFGLEYRW